MSASRHVSPDQMAMFMPAGHLADPTKVKHGDQAYGESSEQLAKRKVTQATYTRGERGFKSLRNAIKKEGVKNPVLLRSPEAYQDPRPELVNGHHRVFTANDLNPKAEVPVAYAWGRWG